MKGGGEQGMDWLQWSLQVLTERLKFFLFLMRLNSSG